MSVCADCGQRIQRGEKHVVVLHHTEHVGRFGLTVTVDEAEVLTTLHVECAPSPAAVKAAMQLVGIAVTRKK